MTVGREKRGEMAAGGEPVFVSAPDLPSGPRSALVVATSAYADSRLRQLRSPAMDAEDLAAVLGDPAIGGFKVTAVIDQPESRIRREIAAFLADRGADETVLVYLSCHGIQDAHGRLFFAAADTEIKYPHATAVRAAELLDELDECRARRQILILDCCFSGSFVDNQRRKGELDLERQLRGHNRGREVLTASRGAEYSFEGEPLGDSIVGSVFTTGLVEGLRTGGADSDKDGHITVEEAYEYAFGYVRAGAPPQTPQRWLFGGEGAGIILARSAAGRAVTAATLPTDLADSLESRRPDIRIGAVNELARWLAGADTARALAARHALRDVADNDVPRVARVAAAHLERRAPQAAANSEPTVTVPRERPRPVDKRWVPRTVVAVLSRPRKFVHGVAFSPDGALLASGGGNKIFLWDTGSVQSGAPQKRALSTSGLFSNDVHAVTFSPDGLLLVSISHEKRAILWEVATGTLVRMLGGHAGTWDWVRAAAFSPDGALLALVGDDSQVWLSPVGSKAKARVLTGGKAPVEFVLPGHHTSWIGSVAFSPDGALLASRGEDHVVRLWDVQTGTQVRVLDGNGSADPRARPAVAFSPDGGLLASAGGDDKVRLWDAQTGVQARVLEGHTDAVTCLAFSPQKSVLAAGGRDGTVRVWDVATGNTASVLLGHSNAVTSVAFSPTEPLLASAGADKSVRLWR